MPGPVRHRTTTRANEPARRISTDLLSHRRHLTQELLSRLPETLAFCEPLNEALETITPDANPTLDLPYFHEYLPLLNSTGTSVTNSHTGFGLELYLDPPEQQPHALAIYVQDLLTHSWQQSRQPGLKFARAAGRASWLRQHIPEARQIVLTRNPWSQFCSGLRLAHRHQTYTFLMIPLFVISRPRAGAVRTVADWLGIPHVKFSISIAACAATCAELAHIHPCLRCSPHLSPWR